MSSSATQAAHDDQSSAASADVDPSSTPSFPSPSPSLTLSSSSPPPPLDSSLINSYLDADLALLRNMALWKFYKSNPSTHDLIHTYQKPHDRVWHIRVQADIQHGSLANVDDLLDRSIKQRQHQWHELFVGGRVIHRYSPTLEICYFQYASPVPHLISPRDTCYIKARRDLGDGEFLLSYRSVDLPEHAPKVPGYVRTWFEGAHLIERRKKGNVTTTSSSSSSSSGSSGSGSGNGDESEGFTYTYYQHADPRGSIPKFLANAPQVEVILKEVMGIRRAMTFPIESGAAN